MTAGEEKPELLRHLRQRIESAGGISFAEFMAEALYHPAWGYYTSSRRRIGKEGDFFTSSSVHSLFGRLIARQLEQMWRLLGSGPFVIAEQGAGEGHLCLDILDALREEFPACYRAVDYRIVELSPDHRRGQSEQLQEHQAAGRVRWCALEDLRGMRGCLLSNELVDAFPVHLIEKRDGQLLEVFVVTTAEGFGEELRPLEDQAIQDYLDLVGAGPLEGNRGEVNLDALNWMRQVAGLLEEGFVLTIDYGYPAQELFAPHRRTGTLLCYHRHQSSENPYQRVGCQDITAHIDFSALQKVGEQQGLLPLYFGEQYQFLMGLGFLEALLQLQAETSDPNQAQALRMTLKNLILPEQGMGERFKVLIQGKNVGRSELLCARKIKDIQPLTGMI
jgi:SAM-dependent MidA family methyltransferase